MGAFFWAMVGILPFGIAGLAGYWWYNKGGAGGYVYLFRDFGFQEWRMELISRSIRLDEHRAFGGDGMLSTVASIPFALVGAGVAAWGWVTRQVPYLDGLFGGRSGPYRQVPIDDDGEFWFPCQNVM